MTLSGVVVKRASSCCARVIEVPLHDDLHQMLRRNFLASRPRQRLICPLTVAFNRPSVHGEIYQVCSLQGRVLKVLRSFLTAPKEKEDPCLIVEFRELSYYMVDAAPQWLWEREAIPSNLRVTVSSQSPEPSDAEDREQTVNATHDAS